MLHAVEIVRIASFDLHLHGRVGDAEPILHTLDHGPDDLLALANALLRDNDVATAGDDTGSHHPHMKVVDVEYAGDAFDCGDHARHIRSRRRAFEQHGGAFAKNTVAAVENEDGDNERHDGIGHHVGGHRDHDTRDDHAEGGNGIAQHVQVGAAHVHVVFRSSVEPPTDQEVDDDGRERD